MAKKNETPPPNDAPVSSAAAPVHAAGTIPNSRAQRYAIPEAQQLHYSVVFPDAVPQPIEAAPGVFQNPDGSIYQPREIKGGQFSAMLLYVSGKFGGPTRQIGVPMAMPTGDYPIKQHEKIVRRVEVLFDFEDEMQDFLAQYKTDNRDPLKASFRRAGMEGLYDSETTSPHAGNPLN